MTEFQVKFLSNELNPFSSMRCADSPIKISRINNTNSVRVKKVYILGVVLSFLTIDSHAETEEQRAIKRRQVICSQPNFDCPPSKRFPELNEDKPETHADASYRNNNNASPSGRNPPIVQRRLDSKPLPAPVTGNTLAECVQKLNELGAGWCGMSTGDTRHPSISSVWPAKLDKNTRGNTGPASVLYAWTGAAYDGRHLYFFGGGHADYNGNEIYRYDVVANEWKRLTDPSPVDYLYYHSKINKFCRIVDTRQVPGGAHTYDGIAYYPPTNELLVVNLGPTQIGCFASTSIDRATDPRVIPSSQLRGVYAFSLDTLAWRKINNQYWDQPRLEVLPNGEIVLGSKDKLLKYKLTSTGPLEKLRAFGSVPPEWDGVLIYDAKRNVFWSRHRKILWRLNARNGAVSGRFNYATPGSERSLALDRNGQVILWNGANKIHVLQPESKRWCVEDWGPKGPGWRKFTAGQQRVYSKFRYLPEHDIYIGLSTHEHPVWVHKRSHLCTGPSRAETTQIHPSHSPPKPKPQHRTQSSIKIAELQKSGLVPIYRNLGFRVQQKNSANWTRSGGERDEIGLFPEQHAALIAGQYYLRDSVLKAASQPLPDKISHEHKPNLYWLPYLLTGDTAYVRRMEMTYKYYKDWRKQAYNSAMVPVYDRDMAWSLRDLGQLAYLQRLGVTQHDHYLPALEATRKRIQGLIDRPSPEAATFNIFEFNRVYPTSYGWTGWMQSFLGQSLNHIVRLGFEDWIPIAEWHFQHLLKSSGDEWPLKAVGYDHVFFGKYFPVKTWADAKAVAAKANWQNVTPWEPRIIKTKEYRALPDDHIAPQMTIKGNFLTYNNRAQYAYAWAAMACTNQIARACEKAAQLAGEIKRRKDKWNYKNAIVLGKQSSR